MPLSWPLAMGKNPAIFIYLRTRRKGGKYKILASKRHNKYKRSKHDFSTDQAGFS